MFKKELIIAIPKGRILEELVSFFRKINLVAEDDFYNPNTRKLVFDCNFPNLKIIKVRSFDVATFVKFGAADLGICGLDVLKEFASPDIHPMFDLEIGKCRLSIAARNGNWHNFAGQSHLRIASKYLNLTTGYFASRGIQAECIKLNGAMELAPHLGLCDYIVDLVSTGKTLRENNLIEIEKILDVSSYLVVNRNSMITRSKLVAEAIRRFDVNNLIK